ncbi:MAG: hypothetical protein AW07_00766 [Candidatus Accumulibacter sp. SK-11]|nr:MAG: hypothetical protein AW07_00766 [Candidatus Accumulibacter sp. SK-11]
MAGDQPVQDPGERVEVAPRSLPAIRLILLGRREAWCHDSGQQLLLSRGAEAARRAEVEQHRRTVGAHVDVARLDVAVQETGVVDRFEPVEQRPHDALQRGAVDRFPAVQPAVQWFAALIFHDHVGGSVGGVVAQHADDPRMVEAGECPTLVQEAVETPGERAGARGRVRPHGEVGTAPGGVARQVFLDRHRAIEMGIVRQVGDAEATTAKDAVDPVLVH